MHEATRAFWESYATPLNHPLPLAETRLTPPVRTALFLAGSGGVNYARAVHHATGLPMVTPPNLAKFARALRWYPESSHGALPSSAPALRGLDVDRAAARRDSVVIDVSGMTPFDVRRHKRQFEAAGYACRLLRVQTVRDVAAHPSDGGLDGLFRHHAAVVESPHAVDTPWLRLYDTALRTAVRRLTGATHKLVEAGKDPFFDLTSSQRKLYDEWTTLANLDVDDLVKFHQSFAGKYTMKGATKSVVTGVDYHKDVARWVLDLRDLSLSEWTDGHWQWAAKQVKTIKKLLKVKGPLRINRTPTPKLRNLLMWGHDPRVKKSPPHALVPPTESEPESKTESIRA